MRFELGWTHIAILQRVSRILSSTREKVEYRILGEAKLRVRGVAPGFFARTV